MARLDIARSFAPASMVPAVFAAPLRRALRVFVPGGFMEVSVCRRWRIVATAVAVLWASSAGLPPETLLSLAVAAALLVAWYRPRAILASRRVPPYTSTRPKR